MPIRLFIAAALLAFDALAAELPPKIFALPISHGSVPPQHRTLRVDKGDEVRLLVTSDAAGALHLHGYGLSLEVTAGKTAPLEFRAYATGRYPLEWHGAGGDAAKPSHHAPPLAAIEVRPK